MMLDAKAVALSRAEVEAVTGYKQPSKQLEALRAQGFWRARRSPLTGAVILERAHYEAVCAGVDQQPAPALRPMPRLRSA